MASLAELKSDLGQRSLVAEPERIKREFHFVRTLSGESFSCLKGMRGKGPYYFEAFFVGDTVISFH